ncbi:hypothetical protein CR513_14798, partial [Mucuna pruriens]
MLRMTTLLKEFKDVFPNDIPLGFPPLKGIEHYIDLFPRASLTNKADYWTNLKMEKKYKSKWESCLKKDR